MIALRSLAMIYVNTLLCVVNKFIGVWPLLLQPMPPALLLPLLARGFAFGIPYAAGVFLFAFVVCQGRTAPQVLCPRVRASAAMDRTAP